MRGLKIAMQGMPYFLYKYYTELSYSARMYVRFRWQLCPFTDIEKFIPKQANVIDIGCGLGMLSNYLALMSKDRQVLGIDISEKRINDAKKTLYGRRNIEFLLAGIKNIKFGDRDAVVMTDFLHHISFEQQENLLREISTRLKAGGRLVIQEVDSSHFFQFFLTKFIDMILNPGKDLFYRDKKSWFQFLCRLGFEIEFFHINILFLPDVIFICKKGVS